MKWELHFFIFKKTNKLVINSLFFSFLTTLGLVPLAFLLGILESFGLLGSAVVKCLIAEPLLDSQFSPNEIKDFKTFTVKVQNWQKTNQEFTHFLVYTVYIVYVCVLTLY